MTLIILFTIPRTEGYATKLPRQRLEA